MEDQKDVSRRQVLTTLAAGTSAAVVIGTQAQALAAKAAQAVVRYQDTPKGALQCDNCLRFEPPSSCQSVAGTISPQGWCLVYVKKPA